MRNSSWRVNYGCCIEVKMNCAFSGKESNSSENICKLIHDLCLKCFRHLHHQWNECRIQAFRLSGQALELLVCQQHILSVLTLFLYLHFRVCLPFTVKLFSTKAKKGASHRFQWLHSSWCFENLCGNDIGTSACVQFCCCLQRQ